MRQIALLFIAHSLFACSGAEPENDQPNPQEKFISEVTIVDESYPALVEEVVPIMDQLEICAVSDTVESRPPCSNEYFRIFDYLPSKDWNAGFIVEMVPGLYGSPVHQIVIIKENLGKFQIVNQYFGHMIELRTKFTGYSDLLIGYDDPAIGVVAIKHVWEGNKYEPIDVEEINNHFVKPEMKDSINNIFIPAFSAGH